MVYHTAADVLRTSRVTSVQIASPTVKIVSFKDDACSKARPGQFLMVWIPGVDEIPFSIMGTDRYGVVSIAVKNVGEATNALQGKKPGDTIGIRGPFGNNFTQRGRRLLAIGGGTGVAPLLFLTRSLILKRVKMTFVLGAKTRDELLLLNELEKLRRKNVRLVTSTEDGSCGITGLCTKPVDQILGEQRFDMIYACGPEPMIAEVFELAERRRVDLQASLERWMRCAIGLCGSCVIGKYRVCRDGPVFTSKKLREVKNEFGSYKRDQFGRRVTIV